MRTKLDFPFADLHGCLGKYHFYHYGGKIFLKRRPTITKPPTPKQLECRKEFASRYAVKKNTRQSQETA